MSPRQLSYQYGAIVSAFRALETAPGYRGPAFQRNLFLKPAPTSRDHVLGDRAVAAAPQHPAGQGARMGRVVDHHGAVDDDGGAFAARIAVRVRIARPVVEVGGVEDGDVGPPARPEQAAVGEPQGAR